MQASRARPHILDCNEISFHQRNVQEEGESRTGDVIGQLFLETTLEKFPHRWGVPHANVGAKSGTVKRDRAIAWHDDTVNKHMLPATISLL